MGYPWHERNKTEMKLVTCSKSGHLLYKNNSETNDYIGNVVVMINKRLKHRITKMQSMSSRVIYIILRLNKWYSLQIKQVHASTSSSEEEEEEMEQLYKDMIRAKNIENPRLVKGNGESYIWDKPKEQSAKCRNSKNSTSVRY